MAPKIEHTEENYDRLVGDAASLTALRASLRDQGEYDPEILGDRSLDDWREFAKETTITLWQHSTNGFRGAFFELLNLHPDMAADKDNPEGGKLHPFMPYDYVDYEGEWRLPIAMLLAGMSEAIEVGPDNDGTARLWSTDGRGAPRALRGHAGRLMAARFSPDGARALTAAVDGELRVWSIEGAGAPTILRGDGPAVMAATFSRDGASVVFGTASGTVFVGDVDGAREPVALRGHTKKLHAVELFPDGRVLSGSFDGDARVWRVPRAPDGLPRSGASRPLARHDALVGEIEYAKTGGRFATASMDGIVRVWNSKTLAPELVLEHGGWVGMLAWGPDGDRLISASQTGTVRLWDLASAPAGARTLRSNDATTLYAGEGPAPFAWSSDGARVAIGGGDHLVRVMSIGPDSSFATPTLLAGHEGPVFRLEFSHDGAHLASIDDRAARVWASDPGGAPLVLGGHTGRMSAVAWSPDDRRVVTAAEDGVARVWDVRPSVGGGLELAAAPRVLDTGAPEFTVAYFSPSGESLVTASITGTIRVWPLDGGAPTVLDSGAMTFETAFSPDGRWIASAGEDSNVRLWTADGRHGPFVLEGHREGVRALAFSPDGRQLVTGGEDRTPRVWALGLELDADALRERLAQATTSCLRVEQRERLLAEGPEEARAARDRCEARYRPTK